MSGSSSAHLERVLQRLDTVRDIVDERAAEPEPPRWATVRGWEPFLLELADGDLARCEILGLPSQVDSIASVPDDLRDLAREVGALTEVERLPDAPTPVFRGSLRQVAAAKRTQLDGLLRLCEPLVRGAARVVDVGAGHGHLARWISEIFGVPVLGLEREPARVQVARRLLADGSAVQFGVADLGPDRLDLRPGDLAVGLHACGELGDAMVRAVAVAGCEMVLVSCCHQKIRGVAREPLSVPARTAELLLSREVLGLANLTVRAEGVAGTLAETTAARRRRLALRFLLRARGFTVAHGEEMRGLNRRRAYGELEGMALDALCARGAPAPTAGELADAIALSGVAFERIRRLSLPRNMLARLLEVAIALDRARFLEEQGRQVRVLQVFDERASPRNIAVVAGAPSRR